MDIDPRHIDDIPDTADTDKHEEPLGGGSQPQYDPKGGTPQRKEWRDEDERQES